MSEMSPRGALLLGAIRRNFDLLAEHDKTHPLEVLAIVGAMVSHLRSWKAQALLVTSPEPRDG